MNERFMNENSHTPARKEVDSAGRAAQYVRSQSYTKIFLLFLRYTKSFAPRRGAAMTSSHLTVPLCETDKEGVGSNG